MPYFGKSAQAVLNLMHHVVGVQQRVSRWRADVHGELARIVIGHESRADNLAQYRNRNDQRDRYRDDQPSMVQRPFESALILLFDRVEHAPLLGMALRGSGGG